MGGQRHHPRDSSGGLQVCALAVSAQPDLPHQKIMHDCSAVCESGSQAEAAHAETMTARPEPACCVERHGEITGPG